MPQTKFENNTKIVVIPPSAFSQRGYSATIHPEGYVYFTKSDATDCAPLGNTPDREERVADDIVPESESTEVVIPETMSESTRGSCDMSEESTISYEEENVREDSEKIVHDAEVIPVINNRLDQTGGSSSVKLSNKQRKKSTYKRLNKNLLLVRNMNDVQANSFTHEKKTDEVNSGEHTYCQVKDDCDQGCADDDSLNNCSQIKPEEASLVDDLIQECSNMDNSPECGFQSEANENVIGRAAMEDEGRLIGTNEKTILLEESELDDPNASNDYTDSEDSIVKNNNVLEEKSSVYSLYGKRKLHKSYIISWGIQISCDGFARCLIETCNFISLDLQTIQEHYKLCDGVQHFDRNLCPSCNNWLYSENELLIHKTKCKGKSKTLLELSDGDKDKEEISRFQKLEGNNEDELSSSSESNENKANASNTDQSDSQQSEGVKYCEQCEEGFLCDADYSQHIGSCRHLNRNSACAQKKNDSDKCVAKTLKKKIKGESNENCIVQPMRDIPKDQYIRRRAYTKQHKTIWEAAIQRYKHVKCAFQNCHFLALSVDDMISHFGYCNGDGSYAKFVCPYCEGRVTSEKFLEIHIQRSHMYEDFEEGKSHFLDGMLSNEDQPASPRSEDDLSTEDITKDSDEGGTGNEEDIEVKEECDVLLEAEDEMIPCKEEKVDEITLEEEVYRSDEETVATDLAASPGNSAGDECVKESSNENNLSKDWDEGRGDEDEDSILSDDQNEMVFGHSVFQNSQTTQCCPKNCLAEKNYKDDHIYYKRMSNPLACCSKGFKSLLVKKNINAKRYSGPKNEVKDTEEKKPVLRDEDSQDTAEDEEGGVIEITNEETDDGGEFEEKAESEVEEIYEEEEDESDGKYVRQKIKFSFPSIQTTKRKILKYYVSSWLESIQVNGFARCLVATCNFISLDIYHIQNHFKTCDGVPATGPNLCTMCNSWLPSAVELSMHASKCRANTELDSSSTPNCETLENGLMETQKLESIDMDDKVGGASCPAHCLRDPVKCQDGLTEDQTEPESELTCRVCRRKFGSAVELSDHDASTHRNDMEDEKENVTSLRISHIKKLKENDDRCPSPIIQTRPDLPKGQYLRRRPYTKQHKVAWESTLEKLKYVKCIFQNCHFLAMSLEDMIYHFGYCIGDGSFAKFECPHCGGRLTTKKILDIHINLSHTNKAPDEEGDSQDEIELSGLVLSVDDMKKLLAPKEVRTYKKMSKNSQFDHSGEKERSSDREKEKKEEETEEELEESSRLDSIHSDASKSEDCEVKFETEYSVVEDVEAEDDRETTEYDGSNDFIGKLNDASEDGHSGAEVRDKLVEEDDESQCMAESRVCESSGDNGQECLAVEGGVNDESNASEGKVSESDDIKEDQSMEGNDLLEIEEMEAKVDEEERKEEFEESATYAMNEEVTIEIEKPDFTADVEEISTSMDVVESEAKEGGEQVAEEQTEKFVKRRGRRNRSVRNDCANESESGTHTKEPTDTVLGVTRRSTRQSLERQTAQEGRRERWEIEENETFASRLAKRRRVDANETEERGRVEESPVTERQTRRRGRPSRGSVNNAPAVENAGESCLEGREPKVEVSEEIILEPQKKVRRGRKRKCGTESDLEKEPEVKREESEPNVDEVKCAKCEFKTRRKNFMDHNYKKHVGLAWIEGEEPIDTSNEESISRIIKQAFKVIKMATCENCESVKKSALGFISHVQNCGKSEEEREACKVTCPYCPARVLKYSLPMHLKLSHPQTPFNESSAGKDTPTDETNLEHPTKRRSALNAINKFHEVLKQCGDDEDTKKKVLYVFYEKGVSKFPRLPHKIRGLWNKMKKEEKKIPCRRGSCLIESSDVHEAIRHHFLCPELPDKVYVCQLCDYYSTDEDNLQQHVNIHATMDEDFAMASEDERLEEEAEFSAQLEAEEYGEEPEPCMKTLDGSTEDSSIEAAYRSKFFWREAIVNERKKLFFRQSMHMTLLSEKEDLEEKIVCLPELHSKIKDWITISPERAVKHLPSLKESISFDVNTRVGRRDFNWKRYKRFEGGIVEGSQFLFTGGSVLSMSWCKISYNKLKAREMRQYLAVSSSRRVDKYQNIHETCEEPSGLIQIWDCGVLKSVENATEAPKMVLGLVHNSGIVWDLAWSPADTMEESKDGELAIKLGLLGAACQDGTIRIWSIRNPDLLPKEYSLPLYRVEPCVILELEKRSQEGCLRIAFGRSGIIAGGFTNGLVAVWNLKSISLPFSKTSGNSWVLKPHISIQAHRTSITALSICPNSDRYIATSGLDRYVKFWDLENAGNPFEHVLKEVCLDNVWPRHWPLTISTFEDVVPCCGKGMIKALRDAYCDKHRAPLAMENTCWSLSFNEWMNILCGCNNVGQVRIRYFRNMFLADEKIQFTACRTCTTTEAVLLREHEEDIKEFLTTDGASNRARGAGRGRGGAMGLNFPRTYDDANHRFGLVFHEGDSQAVPKGKAGKGGQKNAEYPIDSYPIISVDKVAWNPNFDCFTHLAVGHHSGIISIKRILDIKNKDLVAKFIKEVPMENSRLSEATSI